MTSNPDRGQRDFRSHDGVSTLADGTYRITVSAGTTLTFQYIGYKPFRIHVSRRPKSVTCDVALQAIRRRSTTWW